MSEELFVRFARKPPAAPQGPRSTAPCRSRGGKAPHAKATGAEGKWMGQPENGAQARHAEPVTGRLRFTG